MITFKPNQNVKLIQRVNNMNHKPVEAGSKGKVKQVLTKPANMVLVQFNGESDNLAFIVPGNLELVR